MGKDITMGVKLSRSLQLNKQLADSLVFLVDVKDHKDKHGKDEWYLDAQPMALKQSREAITEYNKFNGGKK